MSNSQYLTLNLSKIYLLFIDKNFDCLYLFTNRCRLPSFGITLTEFIERRCSEETKKLKQMRTHLKFTTRQSFGEFIEKLISNWLKAEKSRK